jgi:nitrite reductase/ring-hydroxylating ferredoxin subunit
MSWTSLCDLSELTENAGKQVDIDGFQLAVFLSMSGGWVDNGCAVCPRHAWSFQLATGQLAGTPGFTIKTYPTRLLPRPDNQPPLVQADLPIY